MQKNPKTGFAAEEGGVLKCEDVKKEFAVSHKFPPAAGARILNLCYNF